MKVLYFEPGKPAYIKEIDGDLRSMQRAVGGYIEITRPFENPLLALVTNEEGKLMGLPLNRLWVDLETGRVLDYFVGNFFVCGIDEENLRGLTEDEAKEAARRIGGPLPPNLG